MPGSAVGMLAAFVLGLSSHYVLDAVPHWERLFGQHFNDHLSKNHNEWPRHVLVQGAVDTFIGIILLRYFVINVPPASSWPVLIGGLSAALPDVIDNMPFWAKWTKNLPIWRVPERIHRSVHISDAKQSGHAMYTGLATQVITVATALSILISK